MTAILKKELRTYFRSITGYVFLGFFLLITGLYFSLINVINNIPYFSQVLASVSIAFLILIPTITMRLFSEEMRHKTDQLLLTSPTSVPSIIIGKYLAAVCLMLIAIAITIIYPVLLSRYGEVPVAEIQGAYLGFFLTGACFISVGLFISVLTENQIVAAVSTFALLFFMYIMNSLLTGLPKDRTSSLIFVAVVIIAFALLLYYMMRSVFISIAVGLIATIACVVAFILNNMVFDGVMIKVLEWFSLMGRFENFAMGILDVGDVVYYITFCAAFVYLSIAAVEKRRWS